MYSRVSLNLQCLFEFHLEYEGSWVLGSNFLLLGAKQQNIPDFAKYAHSPSYPSPTAAICCLNTLCIHPSAVALGGNSLLIAIHHYTHWIYISSSMPTTWPVLWPLWPVLWQLLTKCQHWLMVVVTGDHGQVAVASGQAGQWGHTQATWQQGTASTMHSGQHCTNIYIILHCEAIWGSTKT